MGGGGICRDRHRAATSSHLAHRPLTARSTTGGMPGNRARCLLEPARLRGTPDGPILQHPRRCRSGSSRAVVRSRAAILTLPLGVLQQGDVEFDPPLPRPKREAIQSLVPGKAFKMQTSFKALRGGRSFWPEGMAMLSSALDSQLHWPTSLSRRRGQRRKSTEAGVRRQAGIPTRGRPSPGDALMPSSIFSIDGIDSLVRLP